MLGVRLCFFLSLTTRASLPLSSHHFHYSRASTLESLAKLPVIDCMGVVNGTIPRPNPDDEPQPEDCDRVLTNDDPASVNIIGF